MLELHNMRHIYFITALLFLLSITASVSSYTQEENCEAQLRNTSVIPGLKEELAGALKTKRWQDFVKFLKENLCERSKAYEQALSIKRNRVFPNEVASLGHFELLNILVLSGLDVNQKYDGESYILHKVARNGRNDLMYYLLYHGVDIQVKTTNTLYTPLHSAAEFNSLRCLSMLIEYGAEINTQTYDGSTPLHLAAEKGHADILNYLVDLRDCDKTIKNKKGKTALQVANEKGDATIIEILSR